MCASELIYSFRFLFWFRFLSSLQVQIRMVWGFWEQTKCIFCLKLGKITEVSSKLADSSAVVGKNKKMQRKKQILKCETSHNTTEQFLLTQVPWCCWGKLRLTTKFTFVHDDGLNFTRNLYKPAFIGRAFDVFLGIRSCSWFSLIHNAEKLEIIWHQTQGPSGENAAVLRNKVQS